MRTVTVTGHGEARVVPDSAVVRVAAVHRAAGVADALAGADSAARQAVATGREHPTPERIGSTAVQIWPTHDQRGTPTACTRAPSRAPAVSMSWHLIVRECRASYPVGERLQIEGVSLEVTDRAPAETAAREAAYADAVDRGTHLAGLAGSELGDPQAVMEGAYADPPVGRAMKASLDAVALEPGELAVTSSVTVTFQLR